MKSRPRAAFVSLKKWWPLRDDDIERFIDTQQTRHQTLGGPRTLPTAQSAERTQSFSDTVPQREESKRKVFFYLFSHGKTDIPIIDGHGVGVWGCAHPPKNLKSPDTPPCRRQGGCAPWCQRPRRKIFHAHPGGSIFSHFLAKSPRCLLNKPPNKKII